MKILLIRHGQMAGDPYCRPEQPVSGCLSDADGVPQAEATCKALADTQIDIAFSSPYGRALQTAEITMGDRDVPIQIIDNLHEWLPADRMATSTVYENMVNNGDENYIEQEWKTDLGEGVYDMYARIIPALLDAFASIGLHMRMGGFVPDEDVADKTIAIFAHGGTHGVVLPFLLGMKPFPLTPFSFALTGVAELDLVNRNGIHYPTLKIHARHDLA